MGSGLRLKPTKTPERKGTRPPVLVLNTYAGSLLLGAKSLGLDVLGSYEDVAFGTEWQVRNFPELDGLFASHRELWPTNRLDDAVVIAHPPCAAFSLQGKTNRKDKETTSGVNNAVFKCTVEVMHYAMSLKCAALLVESVQGALDGAREVHDHYAALHGYKAYRVLQNAATFGLPQWRPRFWIAFVREDIAPAALALQGEPSCIPVGRFLASREWPGGIDPRLNSAAQRAFLMEEKGLSSEVVDELFRTPGKLAAGIKRRLELQEPIHEIGSEWCIRPSNSPKSVDGSKIDGSKKWRMGTWMTETLNVLNPDDCTPVLMNNSWWAVNGVDVKPSEYRGIMGFPADYKLDKAYRLWLSKGVCPPVAAFLLDKVISAVEGKRALPDQVACEPGQTVDLQISKTEWRQRAGVAEPEVERVAGPRVSVPREPRTPREKRPVERKWMATVDEQTCDFCRENSGKTVEEIIGPMGVEGEGLEALIKTYCTSPFGCRCHPVSAAGAGVRAPREPREPRPPRAPREKAARKKRVVLEFVYTAEADITRDALDLAFQSRKEVVCPPLLAVVALAKNVAQVKLQYEPPNAGGHRGDVTRIADRGRRALDAMGLGPVALKEVPLSAAPAPAEAAE